jgi:hypothetical protein
VRFRCQFSVFNIENDIGNACDGETHIQTAHPKRKCNRPLRVQKAQKSLKRAFEVYFELFEAGFFTYFR